MGITWILVANASLARLYAHDGPQNGLQLVKELAHPASRQKNAELASDRAGHMQSTGNGHGSRQPAHMPKETEARSFAHSLAHELYLGRSCNRFVRAILIAPPAFMGMLNSTLDRATAQLVSDRFEKDYTKVAQPELRGHLGNCLFI
ncbi:MAG: host attachment protein [Zoogloea sp.]|nr:host attachment protein [Zoogloea sp.]